MRSRACRRRALGSECRSPASASASRFTVAGRRAGQAGGGAGCRGAHCDAGLLHDNGHSHRARRGFTPLDGAARRACCSSPRRRAKKFFPNEDPLGKHVTLRLDPGLGERSRATSSAIAADVKQSSLADGNAAAVLGAVRSVANVEHDGGAAHHARSAGCRGRCSARDSRARSRSRNREA